jgi:hypothetical protein
MSNYQQIVNWKELGRRRPWCNLNYCLGICLGTNETTKDHTGHAVSGLRYEIRTSKIRNKDASHLTAILGLCSWNSALKQPKNHNSTRIRKNIIFIKPNNWLWSKMLCASSNSISPPPPRHNISTKGQCSCVMVSCTVWVCVFVCVCDNIFLTKYQTSMKRKKLEGPTKVCEEYLELDNRITKFRLGRENKFLLFFGFQNSPPPSHPQYISKLAPWSICPKIKRPEGDADPLLSTSDVMHGAIPPLSVRLDRRWLHKHRY